MKIEIDPGCVRFSQVLVGKCFLYEGHVYQRVTYQNKKDIAVNLLTGQAITFTLVEVTVKPINLKVVEDL